jgi:hypothetical protein
VSTDQTDLKLDLIAQSLVARSNGAHDASFVKDLVARIAAEFDDVPVRDYVEVLVAKEAADELRRLQALQLVTC